MSLARVWIPGVCKHERTRCIHGDEGWARMKVYTFRWWKESIVRRQSCLDCGRALDRAAICTYEDGGRNHVSVTPPARPGADS